jgi:hypothetical protein
MRDPGHRKRHGPTFPRDGAHVSPQREPAGKESIGADHSLPGLCPRPPTRLHRSAIDQTLGTGKRKRRITADTRLENARGDAIVALSTMIGAMTIARVVTGSDLSSEIPDRAKNHLHRRRRCDGVRDRKSTCRSDIHASAPSR